MNAREEVKDRYARALALGSLCGVRSLSGPVLASQPRRGPGRSPLQRQLAKPAVARVLATLAAAELVADKLPFVPPRTQLPSLLARAASAALTEIAVGAPLSRPWWRRRRRGVRHEIAPALTAALAAVASAGAAYQLRQALKQRWRVSSLMGGLLEDAVLLVAASRLRT